MMAVFKMNERLWRANPAQDVVVSIGFHQEAAATYVGRVATPIKLIREYSSTNHIPLELTTTI